MNIESRDDSLGFFDSSTGIFTTPVDGRYEMQILINTYLNASGWSYRFWLQVDGITHDQLTRFRSYSMATYTSSQMTTELDLIKGQKVVYYVYQFHSSAYYDANCKLNGKTTGCSFIQGKLLKRY